MHDDFLHSGSRCAFCHGFCHAARVPVHRTVANHQSVLRLAGCHAAVNAHRLISLFRPHGAVRRTNNIYGQTRKFLQSLLHRRGILAKDCGVIAFHFLEIERGVHILVHHCAVKRTVATEHVARKENTLRRLVGYHRFGPMHHRHDAEIQAVRAELQLVAVGNDKVVLVPHAVEPLNHLCRLFVAHEFCFGEMRAQQGECAGVVRLNMVDDYIVGLPLAKHAFNFLYIFGHKGSINGVDKRNLFVYNKI